MCTKNKIIHKTRTTQKNCLNYSRFKDERCQRNTHEKKFQTHVYPREKILDSRSSHEKKIRTHDVPTRKNVGPTKYPQEKLWDQQSTHEKKFQSHEIPTRKNSEPTTARWHDGTGPTRLTLTRDPWNLTHSPYIYSLVHKRCLLTYGPKSQQSLLT